LLAAHGGAAAAQNQAHRTTARGGLPLLNLQQQFVDLRFGMLQHFNMATFPGPRMGRSLLPLPNLSHPTALDRDQRAAAAQSPNRTWDCLKT
jgi:alpha-L-fucosidase